MSKRVIFSLVLAFIGITFVQISRLKSRAIFCDVGQGDGVVITSGSSQILIDGGSSGDQILSCLGRYLPYWDREIEVVVMTNTDRDHSGGLSDVIRHYQVGKFITADGIKNTSTFKELVMEINNQQVEVEVLKSGDAIEIGGNIVAEVIWPDNVDIEGTALAFMQGSDGQVLGEWDGGDVNERSIAMIITLSGKELLLMADLGKVSEKQMIVDGKLIDVDILKVGHHGSKYSTSQEFLDLVNPEIAVVSVGKNSYGHPTGEVLNLLQEKGVEIYRTDEYGDVVIGL